MVRFMWPIKTLIIVFPTFIFDLTDYFTGVERRVQEGTVI